MSSKNKKLGEVLVESGVITTSQLDEALDLSKAQDIVLGDALLELGFIDEKTLYKGLEYLFHVPYVDLGETVIDKEAVALVSEALAKKHELIPIKIEKNRLTIAMADPLNFYAIDDVLTNIVCDITGIFNQPGLVNVDFDDVRTFLDGKEYAAGLATATGFDRARIAAENAVTSPLLNGLDLSRATGVLVNITAAKHHLKMKEINEAMNVVKAASAEDANIIFGAIYDNQMDQALRVTIIATVDRPFNELPDTPSGGVSYSLQKLKSA